MGEVCTGLETTTDLLSDIVRNGWDIREHSHDFIPWRPRKLNILADYFANKSMNNKSTWQWTWPGIINIRSSPSFQIFTHGGRRDDDTASAAWAIFIIINGGLKLAENGAMVQSFCNVTILFILKPLR